MASTPSASNTVDLLKWIAGLFDAAPGAAYLQEISAAHAALDGDWMALARGLGQTASFQQLYPADMSLDDFANQFLGSLGLAHWDDAQN